MEIARPCPIHVSGCECTDDPVANFSAEAPDPVDVIRMAYIANDPPMNSPDNFYTTPIGTGGCSGPNAQAAQDCATKDAQHDAWDPWVDPGNPTSPQGVYGNQEQTCTIDCGEGYEPFVYTVPAGTVIAHSQAQANAIAATLCQTRGASLRSCVPEPAMEPPIAWWRMDTFPIAGDQVDIISGFRLTPTLILGANALIPGLVNDAVWMHGTPYCGFYNGAANGPPYSGGNMEATGWFRLLTFTGGFESFLPLSIRVAGGLMELVFNSPDTILRYGAPAGTTQVSKTFDAADGAWHFYRISLDATNGLLGLQIDNGTFDTVPVPGPFPVSAAITFQVIPTDCTDPDLSVIVDEVAIWDRVLTAEEVTTLYNGGSGTTWPLS